VNRFVNLSMLGTGPDVVLLHGMPCPPQHLAPLQRALAEAGRRAILVELPGYGASAPLEGEYSMRRAQRAVEDTLLAAGVTEADFVGFSAGAYRALSIALDGRIRVGRVVTLGAMYGVEPAHRGLSLQMAAALEAGVDFGPMMAARLLSPAGAARPEALAEAATWMSAAPREVVAAEMRAMTCAEDLRTRLPALRARLRCRVGAEDAATPPAWSASIAALVPGATLEVVPGCGHALLIEDAPATIAACLEALVAPADPIAASISPPFAEPHAAQAAAPG
jgi:pimeloyl-ACP methyl ester carboxylesterase